MGSNELISAFREQVDAMVAYGNREGVSRIGRPLVSEHEVFFGGLLYFSGDRNVDRRTVVGRGKEHRWAVIMAGRIIERQMGSLAIVSLAGVDDRVLRRVALRVDNTMQEVESECWLESGAGMEEGLEWALRPAIFPERLIELGRLNPVEQQTVAQTIEAIERQRAKGEVRNIPA